MLSVLTVNIGAASRERAGRLLRWLAARPEDAFVLTETSAGAGTTYLLDSFRDTGFIVVRTPDASGDRGTALVSRVPLAGQLNGFAGVSIPGRVAVAMLDTTPTVALVGVYVPSRDRSGYKTAKKQKFVASLLAALDGLSTELRARLVVGGDYNVIAQTHRPLHPGFLPFEFGLLEALKAHGLVDAHERYAPGEQPYSWMARTGDGYCYDYFHVGAELVHRIDSCAYLRETRDRKLTDHSAVTLSLGLERVSRLETIDPIAK